MYTLQQVPLQSALTIKLSAFFLRPFTCFYHYIDYKFATETLEWPLKLAIINNDS